MELYITRHGQTDGNVNKIMDGIRDIPLNETGKLQAEKARDELKDVEFDLIICSPLTRTRQTMEIININNYPVIFDRGIIERDCGEFTGKGFDSLDRVVYWNYYANATYERAENIQDFYKRISDYLDELKVKYKDKRILLVSHGGVSRMVNCYFNGIPKDGDLRGLELNNCEVRKYII